MSKELNSTTEINTFGDARKFILQTMVQLRNGDIPVDVGMAIATNMKVLNDNIQSEISAAKVSMKAYEQGHEFGKVAKMGRLLINKEIE